MATMIFFVTLVDDAADRWQQRRAERMAVRASRTQTPERMSTFDQVAGLPLEIESYELEPLEQDVSSDFTRLTTVIRMRSGGEEGVGEDVTYDALDHVALQEPGPVHDAGRHVDARRALRQVGELDLFPAEPVRDVSRSTAAGVRDAALDLALRQAGRSLARRRSGESCVR